jgi:hypothetical protein
MTTRDFERVAALSRDQAIWTEQQLDRPLITNSDAKKKMTTEKETSAYQSASIDLEVIVSVGVDLPLRGLRT